MMMTKNVAVYIYDDVEVLDFAGPFEVFSTASRVFLMQHPKEKALFNVFTVTRSKKPVMARGGLSVRGGYTFADHPEIDVLIIPGGIISREMENPDTLCWIEKCSRNAQLTASVCTGAFLLAKAGLLNGRSATTHFEDIPNLRKMFPDLDVKENIPYVDEGRIITSAGISAGIGMSLYLVSKTASPDLAKATARQMEYRWNG